MSRGAKVGIGIAGIFGVLVILWGAVGVTNTIQQYRLPSESMEPTYGVGDRVMVGRNGFPFGKAGRGDVVISYAPKGASGEADLECARQQPGASCAQATPGHSDIKFIKRIVATGGDRVSIRGGRAATAATRSTPARTARSRRTGSRARCCSGTRASGRHRIGLGKGCASGPVHFPD